MAIKISGSTIIDDSRNIVSAGVATATSFVKSSGTSSQFLKADGSIDSSTYLTSYSETSTLDNVLGRGNISGIGLSVGVVTATSFDGSIAASNIDSGTINVARLGTGANNAKFLRGDNTWQTVSGGGGGDGSIGLSSSGTYIGAGVTNLNFVGTAVSSIILDSTAGVGTISLASSSRSNNRFVATANQTTFTGLNYTSGYIDVYLNGSKLDSAEFTASNGTSVVLSTGASVNDIVEIVGYKANNLIDISLVSDPSPQLGANLDINSRNITGTGNISITGNIINTGNVVNTGNVSVTGVVSTSGNLLATQLDAIAFAIALG
jgi:hypothetical protein